VPGWQAVNCGSWGADRGAARDIRRRPGAISRGPVQLDVSGGFATPLAAELIKNADLIVGWGCALNMWTLRHGTLVGQDATVVQVDIESSALGAHARIDLASWRMSGSSPQPSWPS